MKEPKKSKSTAVAEVLADLRARAERGRGGVSDATVVESGAGWRFLLSNGYGVPGMRLTASPVPPDRELDDEDRAFLAMAASALGVPEGVSAKEYEVPYATLRTSSGTASVPAWSWSWRPQAEEDAALKLLKQFRERVQRRRGEKLEVTANGWTFSLSLDLRSAGQSTPMLGCWLLSAQLHPRGRGSDVADWSFLGKAVAVLGAPGGVAPHADRGDRAERRVSLGLGASVSPRVDHAPDDAAVALESSSGDRFVSRVERYVFTPAEMRAYHDAFRMVHALSRQLPDNLGTTYGCTAAAINDLRCHELAHAAGRVLGLPVADGLYGQIVHSWLWIEADRPVHCSTLTPTKRTRHVLDVAAVGRIPTVQLVLCGRGHNAALDGWIADTPERSSYRECQLTDLYIGEPLNEQVIERLVACFRETLASGDE